MLSENHKRPCNIGLLHENRRRLTVTVGLLQKVWCEEERIGGVGASLEGSGPLGEGAEGPHTPGAGRGPSA